MNIIVTEFQLNSDIKGNVAQILELLANQKVILTELERVVKLLRQEGFSGEVLLVRPEDLVNYDLAKVHSLTIMEESLNVDEVEAIKAAIPADLTHFIYLEEEFTNVN